MNLLHIELAIEDMGYHAPDHEFTPPIEDEGV